MNVNLGFRILLGMAMVSGSVHQVAAQGTVYDVKGWKIRITPANDNPLPAKSGDQYVPVNPARSPNDDAVLPASGRRQQILIRPASFNQDAALQPAPIPIELAPPGKPANEPTPITASGQIAPSPSPDNSDPKNTFLPGCCGLPAVSPRPLDDLTPTTVVAQTMLYKDIYKSIPYSRAEYYANPSYRHDATMEFLFNQMRPTVIQRSVAMDYGYYDTGYFYPQQPYYPYSYGLRIHRSR